MELADDNHLFEEMTPESPGTIGRNIIRGLAGKSGLLTIIQQSTA